MKNTAVAENLSQVTKSNGSQNLVLQTLQSHPNEPFVKMTLSQSCTHIVF